MLKILDPRLDPEGEALRMAPPLRSLEGAVVGLLDNAKIGTERFFDHVAEILQAQYGVRELIRRRKRDATRPVSQEMLAEMSGADALISAMGDWGSCSSCSLHDAIEAERLGIPAVAVMTDRFERSAQLVAQVNGLAGYPFAVIAHPIANNDDATLRAKAESAVPRIVTLLTNRKDWGLRKGFRYARCTVIGHRDTWPEQLVASTLKLTLAFMMAVMASSAVMASPAVANDWVGVIKRSTGQVHLQRDSEQIAAPAGTEVRRGDRLITGRDGYVNVRVRGASPLSVGPQATIMLDRYIPKVSQTPHSSVPQVLQGIASLFTVNRYR